MKKIILITIITLFSIGLFCSSGYAYTTISTADGLQMYNNNKDLVVADVREKSGEYCFGHIPCAINLPLNSGVFAEEFYLLPKTAPILVVCHSGSRSARAAAMLEKNGYTDVYSLSGGMTMWTGETVTCADEGYCKQNIIYFPHIASGDGWETEIAIINTSNATPLSGIIKAYDHSGMEVSELQKVDLPPAGRVAIEVGKTFVTPKLISYLIFTASTDKVYAYLKFYNSPDSSYRVAIPAPARANQDDIIISHIAMSYGWWTGLNLVNTAKEKKTLTLTFNTGQSKDLTLAAGAHEALNLADFLNGWELDKIDSAVISNAEGIVGLEIFGNGKQLSGILLRDVTAKTLYYPHIADDNVWWTGIVAFNPGNSAGKLLVKPYSADGTLLTSPTKTAQNKTLLLSQPAAATPIDIGVRKRYIGAVSDLDLPEGTKWMAVESTVPVSGFELFGTTDNLQLAGYTSVGIDGYSGVFPKYEHQRGWTGVALINTTSESIMVTLTAYSDAGKMVDSKIIPLKGFQQIVRNPKELFDKSIDTATYIAYIATAPVVAFQINGEKEMLDALPGR